MKGILNSTLADLDAMLNVLIRANFTITQRALPTIIKHKGKYLNVYFTKTCHKYEDIGKTFSQYIVKGYTKGTHYKSIVKSAHKGRWLQFIVSIARFSCSHDKRLHPMLSKV